MRVATASRKARSWVISITLPLKPRSSSSQPVDGVEVEVVGGLVEQQHVGHGDQRLRQRHALLHAARQARRPSRAPSRCRRCSVVVDALLPGPAVQRLDARLQRVEVVAVGVRLVALRAARLRLGHAFADGVEHAVRRRRTAAPAARSTMRRPCVHLQQAVVELLQPGQDLQQRGLAGAVAADQADALAGLEREGGAVEQRHMAEGEVGVGEGQDGHECVWQALQRQEPDIEGAAIMGRPIDHPAVDGSWPAQPLIGAGADACWRHTSSHPDAAQDQPVTESPGCATAASVCPGAAPNRPDDDGTRTAVGPVR